MAELIEKFNEAVDKVIEMRNDIAGGTAEIVKQFLPFEFATNLVDKISEIDNKVATTVGDTIKNVAEKIGEMVDKD